MNTQQPSIRRPRGRVAAAVRSGLAVTGALALAAGLGLVGAAAPASAASCLTIPTGIEAWWPGNATTADLVHGRDGVLANGATYGGGKVGQSFTFDGVDDEVTVADDPIWTLGDADFSQTMWVKFDSTARGVMTSQDEGPGSPYAKWIFYIDSGGLHFWVNWPYNWQPMVMAEWVPTPSTWYHVAVTRSGDVWTLYVNGTAIGTNTVDATLPEIAAPIRLGYAEANENGTFALDGSLDEVQFFHRALDVSEVAAIYTAGTAGLCAPIATSLTVTPSVSQVKASFPVTLSGALTIDGAVSNVDQPVVITRQVNDKPSTVLGEVRTTEGGAFTYVDTPPTGTITYTASFEGASNAVPASASTSVTVAKQVAQVSLTASDRTLAIGQKLTLTATLKGGRFDRQVQIWAKPSGDTKRIVARGNVGPDNRFAVTLQPRLNTTYWATYGGDAAWTAATSNEIPVSISVTWTMRVFNSYARASGYYLFHYRTSCVDDAVGCPTFQWTLQPNHPRATVVLTSQFKRDGRWRSDRISFRLNADGVLRIWYHYVDRSIIGVPMRIRLEYPGDSSHEGTVSPWIYWRVTS